MNEAGIISGPRPAVAFIFKIASDNSSGVIYMCSSLTGESSKAESGVSDIVNDDLVKRK